MFSNFSNLQFVLHILNISKLLLRWCLNHHFRHSGHSVYKIYSVFKFSNLQFVLHILTFSKLLLRWCLNHHFRHSAHSLYKIYSVFKLFEFAVCSAHFAFFEITTPVIRIMLTMANIVELIISDIAQTVYIRFTVFSNFSNLQFVLHILTFWKLLLRWCASC